SHAGVASSQFDNTRKFCLSLESPAHLAWKYRMCWTWFSMTCALIRTNFLVEERRLLSRSLRRMNHPPSFHPPESAEEINGPRTEPRVVVIGKCQNHDAPLMDLLEKTDPLGKITLAIYNHLVPSCRFFLDPFAVPQPPNVSEVRRN